MLNVNYNPDVLSCLANLSSDEVFTPPNIANQMLDLLPDELWSDKNAKFLDPATKSGVFLREIAKRLMVGLEKEIPDLQSRVDHIMTEQLFGIGITELTSLLARRSLYCSKAADGEFSICQEFDDEAGNIFFERVEHEWKNGKCIHCGASQTNYSRDRELETHAYQFIHGGLPERIKNMKFDVIIGNPPYQLDTGGSGRQATPIYNKFIRTAKNLNPRFISMITPSRWFAGGMGLDGFRSEMLADKRLSYLVDYMDSRDCFENVDIAGGVSYFLWDRNHDGKCETTHINRGVISKSLRDLDEFDTFVRSNKAAEILRKVKKKTQKDIRDLVSATVPFGLKTNQRPEKSGSLTLISSGGSGPFPIEKVSTGLDQIDKWKVMTSKASHDHAGQPGADGKRRVLSKLEVIPPQTICTGSYIYFGGFETEKLARSMESYAKTKFFRFLVSLLSFSQDITRERFAYVPKIDLEQDWNDDKLADHFNISPSDFEVINNSIREM